MLRCCADNTKGVFLLGDTRFLHVFFRNIEIDLIFVEGFRIILMVLAVRAGFAKLEWYRNHPKIWAGGRFLDVLGGDSLRE